jgi:hypothetical protein
MAATLGQQVSLLDPGLVLPFAVATGLHLWLMKIANIQHEGVRMITTKSKSVSMWSKMIVQSIVKSLWAVLTGYCGAYLLSP